LTVFRFSCSPTRPRGPIRGAVACNAILLAAVFNACDAPESGGRTGEPTATHAVADEALRRRADQFIEAWNEANIERIEALYSRQFEKRAAELSSRMKDRGWTDGPPSIRDWQIGPHPADPSRRNVSFEGTRPPIRTTWVCESGDWFLTQIVMPGPERVATGAALQPEAPATSSRADFSRSCGGKSKIRPR